MNALSLLGSEVGYVGESCETKENAKKGDLVEDNMENMNNEVSVFVVSVCCKICIF